MSYVRIARVIAGIACASSVGCIRRVERLEPAPCAPRDTAHSQSAIAWALWSPDSAVVSGRVVDIDSGASFPNALIRLSPDTSWHHAAPDGTFRYAGVDTGTHDIEVRAFGFERAKTTLLVQQGNGTRVVAMLAPALARFDECGLIMIRVRRWHIGLP